MQSKSFFVSYLLGYTYRITAHITADNVDDAQKRLSEAIQRDTVRDSHDEYLRLVAEQFEQSLSRYVVKSADASDTSISVFDVSPSPVSAMTHIALQASTRNLLAAAQSVLACWEKGDLADAVRTLDRAVKVCSQPR